MIVEQARYVVIADPDIEFSGALEHALRRRGLLVAKASHREALLGHLDRSDVLGVAVDPMDSRMGWDALEACRREAISPLLVVSSHLNVKLTVRAMWMGAVDVLPKSDGPDTVARRLTTLLGISHPLDERVDGASRFLGSSQAARRVREQIRQVASYADVNVLITGETGTGKELVAAAIHHLGSPDQPWVSVNCAAIPEHLFDSEVFGQVAGAFTEATADRVGLLEAAGRGTVFLDEVGELPTSAQPKLLRALESRQLRRVGGTQNRRFLARVVAATNLGGPVPREDEFRKDLFFRLAGFRIDVPPLRSRVEDIPALSTQFLARLRRKLDAEQLQLSSSAMDRLLLHDWPGNVRELRAVIERAAMMVQEGVVTVADMDAALAMGPRTSGLPPLSIDQGRMSSSSLRALEREVIQRAWRESGGNMARAARLLGIPRTTLRDKLRRLGVRS